MAQPPLLYQEGIAFSQPEQQGGGFEARVFRVLMRIPLSVPEFPNLLCLPDVSVLVPRQNRQARI